MKALILQSADHQFYCTINARNGQVLLTSETYTRKDSVVKMLKKNFSRIRIVDNTKK